MYLELIRRPKVDRNIQLKTNGYLRIIDNRYQKYTYNPIQARPVFDDNGKMQSADQSGVFTGSNEKLLFAYNLPDDMTYHHIIPRNILASFWNKMKGNEHLAFFCQSGAIEELIKHTKSRIDKNNVYLRDKIKETSDIGDKKRLQYQVSTLFEIDGKEVMTEDLTEKLSSIDAHDEKKTIIGQIFQWWPANIHHGPNRRCKGGEEGDGGDGFEESAKYVVKQSTFKELKVIYNNIQKYLAETNGEQQIDCLKEINNYMERLAQITYITRFNAKKWYRNSANEWCINSKRGLGK